MSVAWQRACHAARDFAKTTLDNLASWLHYLHLLGGIS